MANNATTPMDRFVYATDESKGDHRDVLLQLRGGDFVTDCGLETAFREHNHTHHYDAAFMLLRTHAGRQWLKRYYRSHVNAAISIDSGFILETPTLRAAPDWAWDLDVSLMELDELNGAAIELAQAIADEFAGQRVELVTSGCIGSRYDSHEAPGMTSVEAMDYHGRQIAAFARAGADLVTATAMNQCDEAIGIVRASRAVGLPVAVSFDIGGDGHLPSGRSLGDAVTTVDAATGESVAYYTIRCEHPIDAARALDSQAAWVQRVRGLSVISIGRNAETLELVRRQGRALLQRYSHMNVMGGGSTSRRIEDATQACVTAAHDIGSEAHRPWSNHRWNG